MTTCILYSYRAYFTGSFRYCSAILLIGAVTDFGGLPEAGLPSTVNIGFFGFTGFGGNGGMG